MVHTDSKSYWDPVKPRINIYGFTDSSYSSPLYTYNGFTDAGTSDRPIALSFESQTTTAGTFSLEIDDSSDTLDPDVFLRGNRVVIECSKDNSTWQTAYKGLVRAAQQKIFGPNNRTLTLAGYSYLIRLSERVLSTRKQAKLTTAGGFDRTDSLMFSDNVINDLLTNDTNYIHSVDDTQLYNIFKTTNITSSPIDDWIPRIDVALDTVSDGINSVLEFTNSLLTVDFSNDQLVLFNPERVPTTGGAGVFLLTDAMNLSADDANYTMYPVADYTYQISYDYPDSGNRLIGSIGTVQCPPIVIPGTPGTTGDPDTILQFDPSVDGIALYEAGYGGNTAIGALMKPPSATITKIRIGGVTSGNVTVPGNHLNMALFLWNTSGTGGLVPGVIGSQFLLYVNGVSGTAVPQGGAGDSAPYRWETPSGFSFSSHTANKWYWFVAYPDDTISQSVSNTLGFGWRPPHAYRLVVIETAGGTLTAHWEQAGTDPALFMDFGSPASGNTGTPDTVIPGCGGLPESEDADPLMMIASDCNMSKRIGMVEQTVTNMPIHVKNFTTMNEFMYNKLYVMARARYSFDYPAVTVPTTMPKAGDICCHISKKAQVGRARTGVQTGVIAAVSYQFAQDSDSVLGLRKLAISTSGILRGSY